MSLLTNILGKSKSVQKWAIEILLKNAIKSIPLGNGQIAKLWAENQDEIVEEISKAITKTLDAIIKKALAKKGIEILDCSNN